MCPYEDITKRLDGASWGLAPPIKKTSIIVNFKGMLRYCELLKNKLKFYNFKKKSKNIFFFIQEKKKSFFLIKKGNW